MYYGVLEQGNFACKKYYFLPDFTILFQATSLMKRCILQAVPFPSFSYNKAILALLFGKDNPNSPSGSDSHLK